MPVSVSLGLWSTLLIYMVSIPLGIAKATRDGTRFDLATSLVVLIGYAIPGFLFAIMLIVLFAGGTFVQWFPLRGPDDRRLGLLALARPGAGLRLAHGAADGRNGGGRFRQPDDADEELLPGGDRQAICADGAGQGRQQPAGALRPRLPQRHAADRGGLSGRLHQHLFTSALLIEIIFSLNGMGQLGFQAALQRDYPVMFGTLYVFSLLGLIMQIVGDILYTVVDPRIDFSARR